MNYSMIVLVKKLCSQISEAEILYLANRSNPSVFSKQKL